MVRAARVGRLRRRRAAASLAASPGATECHFVNACQGTARRRQRRGRRTSSSARAASCARSPARSSPAAASRRSAAACAAAALLARASAAFSAASSWTTCACAADRCALLAHAGRFWWGRVTFGRCRRRRHMDAAKTVMQRQQESRHPCTHTPAVCSTRLLGTVASPCGSLPLCMRAATCWRGGPSRLCRHGPTRSRRARRQRKAAGAHPLVSDAAVRGGGRLRRAPLGGRALRRHVPAEPGDLRLRGSAGPRAGDPFTHPVGTPSPEQPRQAGQGLQHSTPRRAPPCLALA
jgi:hypothetical protein